MNRLLNLLATFAALLNVTTGCGLRPVGITSQGLLKLGSSIVAQRLGAGNTGTTLESVSAALGGSSRGSLVNSITSLAGRGLAAGLQSGTIGLSSRGVPGSRTDLLPGIHQVQGVSQSFAGAVLMAGGVTGQSSAGLGIQPGATSNVNLQSSSSTQNSATLIGSSGIIPSGAGSGGRGLPGSSGGVPAIGIGGVLPSGIATSGINQVQSLTQSLQHVSQAVNGVVIPNGGAPSTSAIPMGPRLGQNTAANLQATGASQDSGALFGGNGLAPTTVGSGVQQLHTLGQSVEHASQTVAASVMTGGDATRNAATGMGVQLGGRRDMTLQAARANHRLATLTGISSSVPEGGIPGPSPYPGRNPVQGLVQGTRQIVEETNIATNIGGRSSPQQSAPDTGLQLAGTATQSLLSVASTVSGTVSGNGAPGRAMGPAPNRAGENPVHRLLQGANEMGRGLGGAIIPGGSITPQSPQGTGIQLSGTATHSLLNVASTSSGAVSGVRGPGGMGPSPNGAGSGPGFIPGSNPMEGLGQDMQQIGHAVGRTINGGGVAAPHSPAGTELLLGGSSTQYTQSVASRVSGAVTGVAAPRRGMGPSPSGAGPDWNPGQPSQPTSHTPGGASIISVSRSRHSSSSYQAQMVGIPGTGSLGGLPASPGGDGSGHGVPNGAGGNLLGAMLAASSTGAPQSGPGAVGAGGSSVLGSRVVGGSVTSGVVSGITQHGQQQQRKRMAPAAAAAISLGAMAGALTLSAIGAGLAGAVQSRRLAEAGRVGGCPGGGCRSACGRKRRSLSHSKVPSEVLDNISVDFHQPF